MNTPMISVIVPVYKVEDCLKECLDSICNQTYKNLEIILIDDGSPDNCGEICDQYAINDTRISVIHKNNGGLSAARNTGLQYANGDYIAFVDSDDWLDLECYDKVLSKALATDADIVAYDIFEVRTDGLKTIPHMPRCEENCFYAKDKLPLLFSLWPLVWAKLYKKEFIFKHSLRFIENMLYEDNPFVLGCWIRNPKVSILNDHLHYYRMNRVGSITATGQKNTSDVFKMIDFIYNDFNQMGESKHLGPIVNWSVGNMLWLYWNTPKKLKASYYSKMRLMFIKNLWYSFKYQGVQTGRVIRMIQVIVTPHFIWRKLYKNNHII